MSKTETEKKKRKTRLKGSDTQKPCFGCGKTKDRFKDFRPRWAGCEAHRTEKGRRYYQEGCDDCAAKVNGNIRQPRCVSCDAARPKKTKKEPTPTVALTPQPVAAVTVEPEPVTVEAQETETPMVVEPEPEPVMETAEPEAVTVEPQAEASTESRDVTPEPAPEAPRPKIASMADLSKLFGGE